MAESISLDDKVAFLSRPDTYGIDAPVESVETHMSRVFMTPERVHKLKKPVRGAAFDFTTLEARRRNCMMELEINRRLSPDVYYGMVPLTLTSSGLSLHGEGEVVDWLVEMRRLPAGSFLNRFLEAGEVPGDRLRAAIDQLVRLYEDAPPEAMGTATYRDRFRKNLENLHEELRAPHYGLDRERVRRVIGAQGTLLERQPALLDERVRAGRIVEAHGDLRPQHLCLTDPPRIIDGLEFNRDLRVMDQLDELGFLALECRMAGSPETADAVLEHYSARTNDAPEPPLLAFYQSYRALVRCLLAVRHLDDESPQRPQHWRDKAADYLAMADRIAEELPAG